MEGTAEVGAEEAEPFEAAAEAGCKFLKIAEDAWNTAADVITSINDADSCEDVKAFSQLYAIYTSASCTWDSPLCWGRDIAGTNGNELLPNFRVG